MIVGRRLPAWLALTVVGVTAVAVLLAWTASARAATITVANTNDSGPGSLRQAITIASGGDTIEIPAGTYSVDSALSVNKSLTLVGAGAGQTIISGQNATQIMTIASPAAGVTITGVTLKNGSTSGSGGAISSSVPLTLYDDAVVGNTSSDDGGAIEAGAQLTLDRDLVAGNSTTGDGGAIDLAPASPSTSTISDTTLTQNSATVASGAINESNTSTETLQLFNDTIVGNSVNGTSTEGGAFRAWSGTTIEYRNTVFAQNSATSEPTCAYGGGASVTSLGHNLQDGDDSDCNFVASDKVNTNPQLGVLEDNGGPTETLEPAATSPLLNAGDGANCTPTDQRDIPRPQGSGCDIGAVERTTPAVGTPVLAATTSTSATLSATATTVGLGGSFVDNYGTTTVYGASTAGQALASGAATAPATATLTGLTPGTTYHAEVVLSTPDGTATSADVTFTTTGGGPVSTTSTSTTATTTTATPISATVTAPPGAAGPAATTTAAPKLTGVHLTHTRFAVTRSTTAVAAQIAKPAQGTTAVFTLSTPAGVKLAISHSVAGLRSGKRCVAATAKLKRAHAKACSYTAVVGTITRTAEAAGADEVAFSGRIGSKALAPGRYTVTLSATNASGHSTPVALAFTIVK